MSRRASSAAERIDDFEQFVADSSSTRSKSSTTWKSWPQAARDEIAEVLRRNDAGTAHVTLMAMVARLRNRWGLKSASRSTLTTFVESLGRRSWRQ